MKRALEDSTIDDTQLKMMCTAAGIKPGFVHIRAFMAA
jgi:hypothetical protein